jgi:hypothetical protein
MIKRLLSVLFFFVVAACTEKDTEIPKDVLPIKKMKVIVWDLIQAGNYATSLTEKDTSLKKINTAYLSETLKLHKISKADFFKSFDFYQSHPVLNKELFDSVSSYAQKQRDSIYRRRQ